MKLAETQSKAGQKLDAQNGALNSGLFLGTDLANLQGSLNSKNSLVICEASTPALINCRVLATEVVANWVLSKFSIKPT